MTDTVSAEIDKRIRDWCSKVCALNGAPEEGAKPLEGYCRVYAGRSWRTKGAPRVSGLPWREGDDPRELAEALIRNVAQCSEDTLVYVWIEALVRGESSARDSLKLDIEASGHGGEYAEVGQVGNDAVMAALVRVVDSQRRMIESQQQQTAENHHWEMQLVRELANREGAEQAMQEFGNEEQKWKTIQLIAPHVASAWSSAFGNGAKNAPEGTTDEAGGDQPPSDQPAARLKWNLDVVEQLMGDAFELFGKNPTILDEATKARLKSMIDKMEMAKPFVGA